MKEATIIHIPHSSTIIPAEYRSQFLLSDDQLRDELHYMTDGYTDSLFNIGFQQIVLPVSRLVCDPERFRNDADESMSQIGMGAVYSACSDLSQLRRKITEAEREELLVKYYDAHHRKLTDLVDRKLSECGTCLIVDAHSFSNAPLPYEPCQEKCRPDFCVGVDDFHTSIALRDLAVQYLQSRGFSVSVNNPYCGTITPLKHYGQTKNVTSIMIEVNRRLYLNQQFMPNQAFYNIQDTLKGLVTLLSA